MMSNASFDDIPLEHRIVLNSSALLLQSNFSGQFASETIERFLLESYDEFATRLTNDTYLPVFAERFARERLRALARVEGNDTDQTPIVLFLCTHNAGRSQMALGYLKALSGGSVIGWSGGSEPGNALNPTAVEAMAEVGIDISEEFPKPWTDEIVRAADVVITMGCGDACPVFPGKRYLDWELDDPAGQDLVSVRCIRDEIRERVERLITELSPAIP
jgi:protein-tyrosine-phosphatase